MQLVQYSGAEPFVIDDDVTDALMDYAFELVTHGRSDLVRLSARDAGSTRITVTLLLGSGTLSARSMNMVDPVGDELAAPDLRRRIVRLRTVPEGDAGPDATC
ncbi:MAG: hypothetical protein HIU86_07485 [Acidobacteria bacterium]|nr:hypothetical protein [Acidobacteriota bacterium]